MKPLIEGTSWHVGALARDASETREGASWHVSKLARGTSSGGKVTSGHGDKGRGRDT